MSASSEKGLPSSGDHLCCAQLLESRHTPGRVLPSYSDLIFTKEKDLLSLLVVDGIQKLHMHTSRSSSLAGAVVFREEIPAVYEG